MYDFLKSNLSLALFTNLGMYMRFSSPICQYVSNNQTFKRNDNNQPPNTHRARYKNVLISSHQAW